MTATTSPSRSLKFFVPPSARPRQPRSRGKTTITFLFAKASSTSSDEEKTVGGQLGRPSGARFRTYERLKHYAEKVKGTLFDLPQLAKTIEEIYRFPSANPLPTR